MHAAYQEKRRVPVEGPEITFAEATIDNGSFGRIVSRKYYCIEACIASQDGHT